MTQVEVIWSSYCIGLKALIALRNEWKLCAESGSCVLTTSVAVESVSSHWRYPPGSKIDATISHGHSKCVKDFLTQQFETVVEHWGGIVVVNYS